MILAAVRDTVDGNLLVDDMHDPVCDEDVRGDDLSIIDEHVTIVDGDCQLLSVQGGERGAVHEVGAVANRAIYDCGKGSVGSKGDVSI